MTQPSWKEFINNKVPANGGAWMTSFHAQTFVFYDWHQRRMKDVHRADDYTGFRVFMVPTESAQNN